MKTLEKWYFHIEIRKLRSPISNYGIYLAVFVCQFGKRCGLDASSVLSVDAKFPILYSQIRLKYLYREIS